MSSAYSSALDLQHAPMPRGNPLVAEWWEALKSAHVYEITDGTVAVAVKLLKEQGALPLQRFLRIPHDRVFIEWAAVPAHTKWFGNTKLAPGKFLPERHAVLIERAGTSKLLPVDNPFSNNPVVADADDLLVHFLNVLGMTAPHSCAAYLSRNAKGWGTGPAVVVGAESAFAPWASQEIMIHSGVEHVRQGSSMDDFMSGLMGEVGLEANLLPGILALINCHNLVKIEPHDKPWISKRGVYKARTDDGILKRSRVRLHLSRVQQARAGVHHQNHNGVRLHTVSGHFKVRKSGIYWWSDFMRGNPNKGTVVKSYEVSL